MGNRSNEPCICPICGKDCEHPSTLTEHLLSHTGEKPFVCPECGDAFGRKDTLTRHQQTVHQGKRPFVCLECGDAFKRKDTLTDHQRTVHQGKKPFVCPECGDAFGRKDTLTRHQRVIHQGERPFVCPECGEAFGLKPTLTRHLKLDACWYTKLIEQQWERLCQLIAQILLSGLNWKWKPSIPTSDIEDRERIQPEIVIYYSDGSMDFIDAKRSTYAFRYKDLVIYPAIAKKVTFWCLFGKTEGLFQDNPGLEVVSSEDLKAQLLTHRTIENAGEVDTLLAQIDALREQQTDS